MGWDVFVEDLFVRTLVGLLHTEALLFGLQVWAELKACVCH
jgi:hypothetical protein